MVQMLDIIDSYLEQKGHAARRLDGGVKVEMRQKHINEFNNKEDAVRATLAAAIVEPEGRAHPQTHRSPWGACRCGPL